MTTKVIKTNSFGRQVSSFTQNKVKESAKLDLNFEGGCEALELIQTREWKNIALPLVEAVEIIKRELLGINDKTNEIMDTLKMAVVKAADAKGATSV